MAVSSLLAIVGVIEFAVPMGTAVPILVQPAQEQASCKLGWNGLYRQNTFRALLVVMGYVTACFC